LFRGVGTSLTLNTTYFEMTDKSDKYNKLLRAMGLAAEIQGLVRGYLK
jgi:hypothetical protein